MPAGFVPWRLAGQQQCASHEQLTARAEPVVIGARRRPEAVVLSYERYLQLAGGRERVAAALERQAREAGETIDADEALELAYQELHALRRERRDEPQ